LALESTIGKLGKWACQKDFEELINPTDMSQHL